MKLYYNKKKIAAFLVALGMGFSSHNGVAELFSFNHNTTLKDGREIKIYFTTGNTVNDYAYISLGNQVGYVKLDNINFDGLVINNDYQEYQADLIINADSANIYQAPEMNQNIIKTLSKNNAIHVVAKNNDGWYVVSTNDITGFIHESAFMIQEKEIKTIKVTGNKVNVRLTPNTKTKDNILGLVNNGDEFILINHEGNWYLINYYGTNAYISDQYGKESFINESNMNNISQINIAKITGNNVNIRSSANRKSDTNIIGFADITDNFKIIDKQGEWYIIDYLGQTGYINTKYVKEKMMNKEDIETQKMVYLTRDSEFYYDINGSYMTTLPAYQFASVIKEERDYYKVRIDGVIGYINKNNTKRLSNTFIVTDLGRQIVRVYKNNQEIFRTHVISGRQSMQTDIGKYKIGHMIKDYPLTPDHVVSYWMQYNNNEGYHDASWQKDKYFKEVAIDAYDRFASGRALTYPFSYGSHGCDNLKELDAAYIFSLLSVGDDVLIIEPNNLVKNRLIGDLNNNIETQKVKKLV